MGTRLLTRLGELVEDPRVAKARELDDPVDVDEEAREADFTVDERRREAVQVSDCARGVQHLRDLDEYPAAVVFVRKRGDLFQTAAAELKDQRDRRRTDAESVEA